MIQPSDIEEYFKKKKIMDSLGWTGCYKLSAKDVLDFILDNPGEDKLKKFRVVVQDKWDRSTTPVSSNIYRNLVQEIDKLLKLKEET